jgi:phenylalanyl-tRNA synthetase beta chain
MKFTLSWLRDHLETDAPLEQITDTLSRIGLEVEGVSRPRRRRWRRSASRASSRRCSTPTPTGCAPAGRCRRGGIVSVVCGAPNARTGMKAVFAPPGATCPAPASR